MRVIALVLVVGILGLGFAAWRSQTQQGPPVAATEPGSGTAGAGSSSPDAGSLDSSGPGLGWSVPKRWQVLPERPMRIATYALPATGSDRHDGECAVFYFGPGQGGEVDANIERWIGQFVNPRVASRGSRDVHGIRVSRVEVSGTYLAPSGPAMESKERLDRYGLIGAIAEGPNGRVFFKLTGPAATLAKARHEFESLVNSIHRS